jgi:hydroxymethylpyrimidine pyrophosphatase-like HAD family hydrolase
MRYLALACDYDGTLAEAGSVSQDTVDAVQRLRATGRSLILVTGRELDDLRSVFSHLDLFHRVVAENGALLYRPDTREEKLLAAVPPSSFVNTLRACGIAVSAGRVIVATSLPHETEVLQAIHDLGLELQVIFNRGSVMVLPVGINKATGLAAALGELQLSPHHVVAVGDAENDQAFLEFCECAVAVSNALPALKEHADLVTQGGAGAGVRELIEKLIDGDLRELEGRARSHRHGTY